MWTLILIIWFGDGMTSQNIVFNDKESCLKTQSDLQTALRAHLNYVTSCAETEIKKDKK